MKLRMNPLRGLAVMWNALVLACAALAATAQAQTVTLSASDQVIYPTPWAPTSLTLSAAVSGSGITKLQYYESNSPYDGTLRLFREVAVTSPVTDRFTRLFGTEHLASTQRYQVRAWRGSTNVSNANVYVNIADPQGFWITANRAHPIVPDSSLLAFDADPAIATYTANISGYWKPSSVEFQYQNAAGGWNAFATDSAKPFWIDDRFTRVHLGGSWTFRAVVTDGDGDRIPTRNAIAVSPDEMPTRYWAGPQQITDWADLRLSIPSATAEEKKWAAAIKGRIKSQPSAKWIGGWSSKGDVLRSVESARQLNQVPIFVFYNIYGRDCNEASSSGAAPDVASYQRFINQSVAEIGSSQSIVILEPDALGSAYSCVRNGVALRDAVLEQLDYALDKFAELAPHAIVYLDGTHAAWLEPLEIATRLREAHVERARGFALNVSNYEWTTDQIYFGEEISAELATHGLRDVHYVIDTSRNGAGPRPLNPSFDKSDPVQGRYYWCNPPGRRLGENPQFVTWTQPEMDGNLMLDALLWLKTPGESDGDSSVYANCGGPPTPAGQPMPKLAYELTLP